MTILLKTCIGIYNRKACRNVGLLITYGNKINPCQLMLQINALQINVLQINVIIGGMTTPCNRSFKPKVWMMDLKSRQAFYFRLH